MGLNDSVKLVLREYAESLILALLLALFLRFFVVSAYRIPSDSMSPTLLKGDFVLAYKLPYGVRIPFLDQKWAGRAPYRGEVVVFRCPGRLRSTCLKRVVALEGDRVELRDGELWVNERPAEKEGAGPGTSVANYGPVVVPPGHFFALSDDLMAKEDSRRGGAVAVNELEGRVFLIWLSLDWEVSESEKWPALRRNRLFQWIN